MSVSRLANARRISAAGIAGASGVPVVDPRSISGMVLWLDANDDSTLTTSGSSVSEWRNKAGTAHVSQSTANNQPTVETVSGLNGRKALLFDGVNDILLNTTSGLVASSPSNPAFTVIIAHRTGTLSGSHVPFDIAQGASVVTNGIRRIITSQRGGGVVPIDSVYVAFGNRDAVIGNSITASNTAYVHSFVFLSETTSAGNPRYFRNGITSTRTLTGQSDGVPTFTPSRFSVGSSSQGAAENYVGHIAEICVYTGALTDFQRLSVERYLGTKYGIAVA